MAESYSLISEAAQDIEGFERYLIGEGKTEIAKKFIKNTFSIFRLLAEYPNVGRSRDDLLTGLYSFSDIKYQHTIFYKPVYDGVKILAVLSGYQEHRRILPKRESKVA